MFTYFPRKQTLSKDFVLWSVNTETQGTGRRGYGGGVGGWEEVIYLSLHCHHQNDLCIKVGSDESHFNVS